MFTLIARSCVFCIIAIAFSAHAASPVWKVSKGKHSLYLGGTMHLLSPSDYPLPSAYDTAYAHSTKIILETDMQKLQSPEYIGKLMQIMTFQNGQTLKSALNPQTYSILEKYLQSRQLPLANFQSFTPSGFFLTISVLELQRLGLNPQSGVDNYFTQRALSDNKALGELENVDEHISFLDNIGNGREDALITKTINDMEELPAVMEKLKKAWRSGDNKQLEALAITEMKKEFPMLYKRLLTDRNNNWMPKIENMLNDKATEFILVGAMHLAGKEGLIQQLKARGYTLENM